MYFDRTTATPIFNSYRETHERKQKLQAKHEQLSANAAERLRRRLKDTGNARDVSLERATAELKEVNRQYEMLRNEVAGIAYLVAEHYWPKFFRRNSSSVNCPATERDDCIQTAVLKLLLVAHRFDPERGSLFNFLTKCCQREFISHIRKVQQQQVNHIRHVESYNGRESELETLPEEIVETISVVAPQWKEQRPISVYAGYGGDDDTTEIRFAFRPRKQRKCDVPTLGKYVADRATVPIGSTAMPPVAPETHLQKPQARAAG